MQEMMGGTVRRVNPRRGRVSLRTWPFGQRPTRANGFFFLVWLRQAVLHTLSGRTH